MRHAPLHSAHATARTGFGERRATPRHAPVRRLDPREEPVPQPLPLLRDALERLGDIGLRRSASSLQVVEVYEPLSRMRDLRRER